MELPRACGSGARQKSPLQHFDPPDNTFHLYLPTITIGSALTSSVPVRPFSFSPAITANAPFFVRSAYVSLVPQLGGRFWKMLIRRGVADSGSRNRNAQVI